MTQQPCTAEGYLLKRAIKSGRNWKRRYFRLCGDKFSYFDNELSTQKSGEVMLSHRTRLTSGLEQSTSS